MSSEADLLVSLEALKEHTTYMNEDLDKLFAQMAKNAELIEINRAGRNENRDSIEETVRIIGGQLERIGKLQ